MLVQNSSALNQKNEITVLNKTNNKCLLFFNVNIFNYIIFFYNNVCDCYLLSLFCLTGTTAAFYPDITLWKL